MSDVIAEIKPSLGRRWFGTIALVCAGGLLLAYGALNPQMATGVRVVLALTGLAFLWQAQWNLRVTHLGLYVTRQAIFDTNGKLIVLLANIVEIDRGVFAFKPSNGFLLRLEEPEPAAWAPGLYWRIGRRLGIGGATAPAQNKYLVETLQVLLMERTLGPD